MEDKITIDKLLDIVLDVETVMEQHSAVMEQRLLWELDGLISDYHRSNAIVHITGNFSSKGHLCTTMLGSLTDEELQKVMKDIRERVHAHLLQR